MAIQIIGFTNGANCGRLTKEVLEKFAEIIGDHILKNAEARFPAIVGREYVQKDYYDDGDNIVIKARRNEKKVNRIGWFCHANNGYFMDEQTATLGGVVMHSLRSGNQKHECIQIIVSKDFVEYLNKNKDLERNLNALYPDRIIKIKASELESFSFQIADIKVKNQQRLSVCISSGFFGAIKRIFKIREPIGFSNQMW